jgi:hypothetical protein
VPAANEIVVLTWLRLSPRGELSTHPEDDMSQPLTGVFSTCSPNRPNPIGLHRARILAHDGLRIEVDALDDPPRVGLPAQFIQQRRHGLAHRGLAERRVRSGRPRVVGLKAVEELHWFWAANRSVRSLAT